MAPTSFFVSGGTLPLSADSYVERAADRALLDALAKGRYAYVLNARQMGKSSLCVRTIARLDAMGIRTAFVDLTRIGGRNVTPDQWYIGLLGEIGRGIGGRTEMVRFWKESPDVSPMQRFFGALAAFALPEGAPSLVVFVDEVDATRSLPFSADEFFGGIRECFNRRAHDPAFERLTFCLLGAAIPSDLIRDMESSPFNVGERIAVKDFDREEATAFAEGLGERGKELVERVFHWTQGHPFLTQLLCARLAENGARTPADVDGLVEAELFAPSARESNVNLADVGNRVLLTPVEGDSDRHRADILALYDQVRRGKRVEDDESNPRVAILKLAGLVVAENGRLRMRNRIYAHVFGSRWIAEHMPDGEGRRVKRAYRIGLLRATAAGAALLAVVGALGANAAGNARRAESLLLQVRQQRDRAVEAEKKAKEAVRTALAEKARAEESSRQRDRALVAAQNDRNAAVASEAKSKDAAQSANAAAGRERIAHAEADAQARRARLAQGRAMGAAHTARLAESTATAERDRAQRLLYASDLQLAQVALNDGHGPRATRILEGARAPGEAPSWAERRLRSLLEEGRTFSGHRGEIGRMAFAPNGDLLTVDGFYRVPDYQIRVAGPRGAIRRQSLAGGKTVGLSLSDVPGATSLDVAPDGQTVAVATATGEIRLYTADGFRPLKTLPGDGVALDSLRFTAAPGKLLARKGYHQVAVDTGTGRVQDLGPLGNVGPQYETCAMLPNGDILVEDSASGVRTRLVCRTPTSDGLKTRWTLDSGYTLTEMAVSPDAKRLAVAEFGENVMVLDAETGALVYRLGRYESPIHALAFSPLGGRLALGAEDGTVRIVDMRNGKGTATLPTARRGVTSLAFGDGGRTIAIGNADGTATCRDLSGRFASVSGAMLAESRPYDISLSSDGKVLAYGGPAVGLIDPRDGRLLRRFSPPTGWLSVALSNDGKTVAALGPDVVLRAWKVADGRPILERPVDLPPGSQEFGGSKVALSPDGRTALAYSGGHTAQGGGPKPQWHVIDLATGKDLSRRHGESNGTVCQAAFSPGGGQFAVAWSMGDVRLYDAKTRRLSLTLPNPRGDRAWSVAYAPDSATLAVGRQSGWLDLYAARSGRLLRSWPAHEGWLESVAFAPDGGTLITSGRDATVRMWDVVTGRSFGIDPNGYANVLTVAAAPNDDVYAMKSDGSLHAMRIAAPGAIAPALAPLSDRQVFEAALGRARHNGRAVLLMAVAPFDHPFDRMLQTLIADPKAGPILRRRFEVCEIGRTPARLGPTEASADAGFWKGILPALGTLSLNVVQADGRVVWSGMLDPQGDLYVPSDAPESDLTAFLDGLHRGVPAMSGAELETIRQTVDRIRGPYIGQFDSGFVGDRAVEAALGAGDFKAAITSTTVASPPVAAYARTRFYENAGRLGRSSNSKEATDLIVWALRRIGFDASQFAYAAVLYGLADDLPGLRTMADLAPDPPLYRDSFVRAFPLSLLPGGLDHPGALLERLPRPSDDQPVARAERALLILRAGRAAEAEAEARGALAPGDFYPEVERERRRWGNVVIALALAHQGKAAEARAALAVAQGTFGSDTSDAALTAHAAQPDSAAFVLLRREILRRLAETVKGAAQR